MLYNLLHYPVLVAYDQQTNELEGIVTIKYHENSSIETMDPYYQKEGAKFFSITGVLVIGSLSIFPVSSIAFTFTFLLFIAICIS